MEIHDSISEVYENRHQEIFNDIEQKRLAEKLDFAFKEISSNSSKFLLLDFGSGTGNITNHLIKYDSDILAADVSEKSLKKLINKFNDDSKLSTFKLNGEDLKEFNDNSFDMIVTYSVLHHIPDYLSIIREFIRVLKPGGILFIDHEAATNYWIENVNYKKYRKELGFDSYYSYLYIFGGIKPKLLYLRKIFYPSKWLSVFKRLVNSKTVVTEEGDVHTKLLDHIEWGKIINEISGICKIIHEEDYLCCTNCNSGDKIWEKWKNKISDMHLLIMKKN
jgi:ubiquinone/menaquinone biosynthesis C-methylase UbiE